MKKEQILAELKVAKERIEFLESELNKPEKFEFKYIDGKTYCILSDEVIARYSSTNTYQLENFRCRQTKTNANEDFKLQKELMCIGAIAEQLDPDYKSKISWGNDKGKYYIYYDFNSKMYDYASNNAYRALGVVYMPKEVAEKVCDILNNKEVEL